MAVDCLAFPKTAGKGVIVQSVVQLIFLFLGTFWVSIGHAQAQDEYRYEKMVGPGFSELDLSSLFAGTSRSLDGLVVLGDVSVGKYFTGLTASDRNFYGEHFDSLSGQASSPLEIRPGPEGRNLWIAQPLANGGPNLAGINDAPAGVTPLVGAGSISFYFEREICMFGFRTLIAKPKRPISGNYIRGPLRVTFYDSLGGVLSSFTIANTRGGTLALGQTGQLGAQIRGVTIENIDEGGVFVSGIRYGDGCAVPTS